MENNIIFAKGLYYNLPTGNAPDFVRGKLSINVSEFMQFLQQNEKDGKIKLDLKVGKNGKGYASLDTWKPNSGNYNQPHNGIPVIDDNLSIPADMIVGEDVPF